MQEGFGGGGGGGFTPFELYYTHELYSTHVSHTLLIENRTPIPPLVKKNPPLLEAAYRPVTIHFPLCCTGLETA